MIQEIYIRNGLSKREAEVAEFVSRGLSNKEVADKLFVTEKTIKFHLTNIYRKMNISSRTQLIVWSLPYMGFNQDPARQPEVRHEGVIAAPQRFGVQQNSTPAGQQNTTAINQTNAATAPQGLTIGINPVGKAEAS